jgi:hypothetical protein
MVSLIDDNFRSQERMDWIYLALVRDQWRALMNMVVNLQVV